MEDVNKPTMEQLTQDPESILGVDFTQHKDAPAETRAQLATALHNLGVALEGDLSSLKPFTRGEHIENVMEAPQYQAALEQIYQAISDRQSKREDFARLRGQKQQFQTVFGDYYDEYLDQEVAR
jgi:hypothetical protein